MGLRAPFNALQMPKEYINELKAMNGGRNQLSGPVQEASSTRSHDSVASSPPKPRQQTAGTRARHAAVSARPQPPAQSAGSYAGVQ
jgi:hypothetical protein